MQSEAPLTLILSPLRAGRGGRTLLGSLFGDPDTVPPKVPLSLRKRERVRVRVRLDCMDAVNRMALSRKFRLPVECAGARRATPQARDRASHRSIASTAPPHLSTRHVRPRATTLPPWWLPFSCPETA